MLYSNFILALVPLALASPLLSSRASNAESILVVLSQTGSSTSIKVYDETTTKLYGAACSKLLNTGAFEHSPVSYNVNSTGGGSLTVGTETYFVHDDPSVSKGSKCIVVYDQVETMVSCAVPAPSALVLAPLDVSSVKDCAASGNIDFLRLLLSDTLPEASTPKVEDRPMPGPRASQDEVPRQDKRQGPPECFQYRYGTSLVGNGSPYSTANYRQLSETIECGNAISCSAGQVNTESVTIGWSMGIGKKVTEWITGGFSVSQSWTTGNSYTCTAATGQHVCIWYKTAHTAYTVRDYVFKPCNGYTYGENAVIRSPNTNNAGGGYICVAGQGVCHTRGDNYWA